MKPSLLLLFASVSAQATPFLTADVSGPDADQCVFADATSSVTGVVSPVVVDNTRGLAANGFRICKVDAAAWPGGPNAVCLQTKRSSDGTLSTSTCATLTATAAPAPAPAPAPVPPPPAPTPAPPPPAPAPAPTWTQIGVEGQTIKLPASATVRYGIDTRWSAAKNFTTSVACTNGTFGDPAKGTKKVCQSMDTAAPSPSPAPAPAPASAGSLWGSTAPGVTDGGVDTNKVTLGVRFTPSVAGLITGIRFYKYVGNSGTHVANLWNDSSHLKLATATFANETAGNWQTVMLATPAPVAAGVAYVASVTATTGHYAYTAQFFGVPFVAAPLTAVAGVYSYATPQPAFPSSTFNNGNYWVDVVFQATP